MTPDIKKKIPLQVEKDIAVWCRNNYDGTDPGYEDWFTPAKFGYNLAADELEALRKEVERLKGLIEKAFLDGWSQGENYDSSEYIADYSGGNGTAKEIYYNSFKQVHNL